MAKNTNGFETEQARQGEQLDGDLARLLEKIGGSFSDLKTQVQKDLVESARAISKLNDSIETVRADYANRFSAIAGEVASGTHQSNFRTSQDAERCGIAIASIVNREAGGIADSQKCSILGGSGPAGGYIAKETLLDGIIRNVETYGVMESDARIQPVPTQKGRIGRRGQGGTVYYPDLGGEPTDSDLKFQGVEFSLTRWAALCLIDRWFLASELAVPLAEYVAEELGYAIAVAQDTNCFVGDGSDLNARLTGVFKKAGGGDVTAVSGDNTFQEAIDKTVVYLAQLVGGMPEWTDANLKLYMHRSIFWQYMGVRDSQNRPIANVLLGASGKPERQMLSYPVRVTQVGPKLADSAASTAMLVAADLRRSTAICRHKLGAEMRFSEHWKFASGQTAVALDLLQDFVYADTAGIGRLITNAA